MFFAETVFSENFRMVLKIFNGLLRAHNFFVVWVRLNSDVILAKFDPVKVHFVHLFRRFYLVYDFLHWAFLSLLITFHIKSLTFYNWLA